MVDRESFACGMRKLAVLPGREMTLDLIAVYYVRLAPRFSNEGWLDAVDRALDERDMFPAPAYFVRIAEANDEREIGERGARQALDFSGEEDHEARRAAAREGLAKAREVLREVERRGGKVLKWAK